MSDDDFEAVCVAMPRVGRPKSADPLKPRGVRWRDAEWAAIKAAAEKRGLTVGAFVREAVKVFVL